MGFLIAIVFAIVGVNGLIRGMDYAVPCFTIFAIFWAAGEIAIIGDEMKKRRESNELVNQTYAEYLKSLQTENDEKER